MTDGTAEGNFESDANELGNQEPDEFSTSSSLPEPPVFGSTTPDWATAREFDGATSEPWWADAAEEDDDEDLPVAVPSPRDRAWFHPSELPRMNNANSGQPREAPGVISRDVFGADQVEGDRSPLIGRRNSAVLAYAAGGLLLMGLVTAGIIALGAATSGPGLDVAASTSVLASASTVASADIGGKDQPVYAMGEGGIGVLMAPHSPPTSIEITAGSHTASAQVLDWDPGSGIVVIDLENPIFGVSDSYRNGPRRWVESSSPGPFAPCAGVASGTRAGHAIKVDGEIVGIATGRRDPDECMVLIAWASEFARAVENS